MSISQEKLAKRIGLLAVTNGQLNHLGSNPEARIQRIVAEHPIMDILSIIANASHHGDLDVGGYIRPKEGPVCVTNNNLAAILSIALSVHSSKTPYPVKLATSLTMKNVDRAMLQSALCFNDDFLTDYEKSPDPAQNNLRILAPNIYLQERLSCVIRNLLVRANAWFARLPSEDATCAPPTPLDRFVLEKYGITTSEIASALFALWAATPEHNDWLLWDFTFSNISDWPNNYLGRFLKKVALPLSAFTDAWKVEKQLPARIGLRIPRILESPIILLSDIDGRPVYALPFRRALFHYFEESFYWSCFDYFLKQEGRADNTFSNWFGIVFETYCHRLLEAIGTKYFSSLKFLEQHQLAGPDAWDNTDESTAFFEFKARRIRRQHCLEGNKESEEAIFDAAKDVVDGFVRFADQWNKNPKHPLRQQEPFSKHVFFIAITPSQFPINVMIEKHGWFKNDLDKIRTLMDLKTMPRLIFGSVKDLEGIPRMRANGTFIGNLWKQYSKDEERDLLPFYDWLVKKRRSFMSRDVNPYLSTIIDATANDAMNLFLTKQ